MSILEGAFLGLMQGLAEFLPISSSGHLNLLQALFGVEMDPRTLASDLAKQGSADYTRWTDADRRIVRRKQLATEFDTRLTAYFERKRSAVLEKVRFKE